MVQTKFTPSDKDKPKQIDLFLGNIADAPFKDDRILMEFPFFSIQKQPKMTLILFEDDKVQIKVEPGAKGMATVWDKDILIYIEREKTDGRRIMGGVEVTINDWMFRIETHPKGIYRHF